MVAAPARRVLRFLRSEPPRFARRAGAWLFAAWAAFLAGCDLDYSEIVTLSLFGGGAIEARLTLPEAAATAGATPFALTREEFGKRLAPAGARIEEFSATTDGGARTVRFRASFDDAAALARADLGAQWAQTVLVTRDDNGDYRLVRTVRAGGAGALVPARFVLRVPTRIVPGEGTNGDIIDPRTVVWAPPPGTAFVQGYEMRAVIAGPRYFLPHGIFGLLAAALAALFWRRRRGRKRSLAGKRRDS
ncbi:MAG: hypothetical protein HY719_03670 [Planctomycetes bacterium]|nr:hypothetical protein [Planctomycetota bacterium]